jgi:feruloyl esterase
MILVCCRRIVFSVAVVAGLSRGAYAVDYPSLNLPVVKPIMTCDQFAKADFGKISDARITIKTATILDTPKGAYCRITASVDPEVNFRADLPIERWTQRFVLGAQGRYTDITGHASGCMPALNGEIAVATSGGGGNGRGPGGPGGNSTAANAPTDPWGTSPQGRINWAYGTNHMIALAVKDLIKVFYGQPQKFSYMVGCSEGGRQTIEEGQRFPEDFDGLSVGAPVIYDGSHNVGFWHGWEYHVDQRADGSIILSQPKLDVLHKAVLAHCAAASGIIDGMLEQPTACKFDKSWVQCAAAATDTSNCLTGEEANVAEQLYLGPNDGKNFFEIGGWPAGSEWNWRLSTPGKPSSNEAFNPNGLHRTFMPPLSGQSTKDIMAQFAFTQEWWDKTLEMAPLMNAANTNLRPFAQHGDKMILWEGAEDTTVQPAIPISYYEGVQKELGLKMTDSFLRFFLLPGVGHCGGSEGPNQVDTLGPLMAWVEMHQEPKMLIARRASGPNASGGQFSSTNPIPNAPYAEPAQPTAYTRPIFPFPMVAEYTGKGDVNDAANYKAVKGPLKTPEVFDNQTEKKLLGPNNQKFYKAMNDQLLETPKEAGKP